LVLFAILALFFPPLNDGWALKPSAKNYRFPICVSGADAQKKALNENSIQGPWVANEYRETARTQ
jgi:hypothetical protein